MKIRLKLALLLAASLSLLLAIFTYLYYRQVKHTILQQRFAQLESLATSKAHQVKGLAAGGFLLLSLLEDKELVRKRLVVGAKSLPDSQSTLLQGQLKQFQSRLGFIKSISLLSISGEVLLTTDSLATSESITTFPSFQQALQGKPFWGQFQVDEQGKLEAYLAGPVRSQGLVVGVLLMKTDASNLIALTSNYTGLGMSGETLIGISQGETVLVNPLRFGPSKALSMRLDTKDLSLPINLALQKQEGIVSGLDYRGEKVIALTRYLLPMGWGMVVKMDQKEVLQPVTRLIRTLLIIDFVGICLTFLLAYLGSSYISRPIEGLTRLIYQLQQGKLHIRAQVQSGDEIGILTGAFNHLADQLEQKITDLHQANGDLKVLNHSLDQTNQQLQQANNDLQQTNADLTRVNIELDTFVYTASHDLKSPVANLNGLQSLLVKRLTSKISTEEGQILTLMTQSVERLSQTINLLAKVVNVQKQQLPAEVLSFRQVLREVTAELSFLLDSSGGKISQNIKEDQVCFPPQYLHSIIYNLLSNALKYASPQRQLQVEITSYREEDYIIFCMEDNGLGIAANQIEKVFQLFKRLHTHVEGEGIGLYLVKQMMEKNGGKIELESKLGEGSQFKLFFPNTM